jgi:hypothetical protein
MWKSRGLVWAFVAVMMLMASVVFVISVSSTAMAEETIISVIQTDKTDYAPGEIVTITGSNFITNAPITVQVTRPDDHIDSSDSPDGWNGVVENHLGGFIGLDIGIDGSFIATYQLDGIEGIYEISATDGTNIATTTFTDAPPIDTTSTISFSPSSPVTAGTSVTITGKVVVAGTTTPVTAGTLQIQEYELNSVGVAYPTAGADNVTIASGTPNAQGEFSFSFSTTGLGGSTIGFRSHYVPVGGTRYQQSSSGCSNLVINAPLVITVEKTAVTSFTRTYTWSIDKSVDIGTLDLFTGDSGTVMYNIAVTKTGPVDSAWKVTGTIHVHNPAGVSVIIDDVSDVVSPSITGTVDTSSITLPYTLAAGGDLYMPYSVDLPDASTRTNTATVTVGTTDFSGTAEVNFASATITEVNNAINVDDTNGGSWAFSDSGSITYTKTFTADIDAGTHDNTATIRETKQSDGASVTVNCYALTVSKDASTSLTRTYLWSIDKSADQSTITLHTGKTFGVNYQVIVDATYQDSDWGVSGTIHVHNPAPICAVINSISDVVSTGIMGTVDTSSISLPYTLAAGGDLDLPYSADLPDTSTRTNTATVTLQNYIRSLSGGGAWDLTGMWRFDVTSTVFPDPPGPIYPKTMWLVLEDNAGEITGYGGNDPYPLSHLWTVSGSVTGSDVSFQLTYTTSPLVGYVASFIGTIATDGTMSGTWSDVWYSDSGPWESTAGQALKKSADGTTDFSGNAGVNFGSPTVNEVDESVTVSDTLKGSLGTVGYAEAPKTFAYSRTVGPYSDPGTYEVDNTASFVAADSGATDSHSWEIDVTAWLTIFGHKYEYLSEFSEDFGGTLSDWTAYSGSWAIESGELSGQSDSANEAFIWYKDQFSGDFAITFSMKFISTPGDGIGRHGGIMAFSTAKTDRLHVSGYTIDWIDRTGDHGFRVYKWTNGAYAQLGTEFGKDYNLVDGQWYDWKVVLKDGEISLFVGGAFLGSVTDASPYNSGYLGFWLYNNGEHAYFDNLCVMNIDVPLDAWTIRLYDGNTKIGEDVTDPDGLYEFDVISTGPFEIREVLKDGFTAVKPVLQVPAAADEEVTGYSFIANGPRDIDCKDFWNFEWATIAGTKTEYGKSGLADWTIKAVDGAKIYSDDTDSNGNYLIVVKQPGTYDIMEVLKAGWTMTSPSTHIGGATDEDVTGYADQTIASGQSMINKDFVNFEWASICGVKFKDNSGNGVWDDGDKGMNQWLIKLYKQDGEDWDLVSSVLTRTYSKAETGGVEEIRGRYCFDIKEPGVYEVREVLNASWTMTYPNFHIGDPDDATEVVAYTNLVFASNEEKRGWHIGNFQWASICGRKFVDTNGDGVLNDGGVVFEGWTFKLYRWNTETKQWALYDTQLTKTYYPGDDPGTEETITGRYCFVIKQGGTYEVREVLSPGWTMTYPYYHEGSPTIDTEHMGYTNIVISSGQAVRERYFANFEWVTVCGHKFFDANGNHLWDVGEPGLDNWAISLTRNGALYAGPITTHDGGCYEFTVKKGGSYVISEALKSFWVQTCPTGNGGTYPFVAESGVNQEHKDFGNWLGTPVFVTDSSLCAFDIDGSLAGRQFKLTYTPDVPDAPNLYRLTASNPGQFYMNVFYVGTLSEGQSITLTVPYPFVTQGAVPVHAYSSLDSGPCGCLVPKDDVTSMFAISGLPIALNSYTPQAMGSTAQVTLTALDDFSGGFLYINMHLDYGLKKNIHGLMPDPSKNAYDPTNPATIIYQNGAYVFSASGPSDPIGTDTVRNSNVFKRDPGFGGLVLDPDGYPVVGVRVEVYLGKTRLGTVYTDEDGWYMFNWKHTGKLTTYTLKVSFHNNNVYDITQNVDVKANSFAMTSFTTSFLVVRIQ